MGGRRGPWLVTLRTVVALTLLAMLTGACQVWRNSGTEPLGRAPDGALRLATHNVHYILLEKASGAWSVGDWEKRKGALDAAFEAMDADAIAFQEMESFARGDEGDTNLALDWLLENNPGYAAAAVDDPEAFPSTQPILYRRARLEMLDQGWFFFSETPEVVYSRTFDGSYPAFASWARFRDREDGATFRIYNVHTDFRSRTNRARSIELVVDRIRTPMASGETVFVAGDLNARLGSANVRALEAAGLSFVPVEGSTYHFGRGLNLFGAIDHVAHGPGALPVGEPVVVRRRFDGEWPSDHYPVVADFRLDLPVVPDESG